MSSPTLITPALLQDAYDAQAYRLSSFAALIWICYDTVIAMDQEIELVWWSKWSTAKVLYLLARYVTIGGVLLWWLSSLTSLPDSLCEAWSITAGIALLVTGVSVDLIQLLRIRAVYPADRRVTFPLYLMFGGVFLAAIIVVAVNAQNNGNTVNNTVFAVSCLDNQDNTGTLVSWIGEMCLGAVFFLLTLAKLHPYLRGGQTPVLTAVAQDGVIYYAVIFVIELINVLFLRLLTNGSRQNLAGITQPWTLAVYGVAGPRLVLHLKGVISASSGDAGAARPGWNARRGLRLNGAASDASGAQILPPPPPPPNVSSPSTARRRRFDLESR